MTKQKFIKSLFIFIPIILVAVLGSIFVNIGMDWFNALIKPSQWVPSALIPIVWTIIYIAFAIVLSIWQDKGGLPKDVVILSIINGILNVLWCLVFFTLKLTLLGDVVIILNLIAGFWLIITMKKYRPLYSYILLIYPVWLSIATTLNLAMWILN